MPTKKTELNRNFQQVTLYLDDIRKIAGYISGIPGARIHKVETQHYEYQGVEELGTGEEKEAKSLYLSAFDDKFDSLIRLSINDGYVSLSSGAGSTVARGAFEEIAEVLDKGRYTHSLVKATILLGFAVIAGIVTTVLFFRSNPQSTYVIVGLGVLSVLLSYLSLLLRRKCGSRILLYDRPPKQAFWRDNKDKVTIEVIKGVSAALAGSALTLLVQHLTGR